jgi:glycosyltransferase involved in cell wall biosynthesis
VGNPSKAAGGTHGGARRAAASIDVVYFDGGGAHRSAAHALVAALSAADPGLDVRLVHTDDVFQHDRALELTVGAGIRIYNASLKRERMWFGDLGRAIELGIALAAAMRRRAVPRLRRFWAGGGAPRVLASVIPIYDRMLLDAARLERPEVEGVVVPCDFEEIRPRYWFDAGWDAHWLCGTDKLVADARAAGCPEERVHRIAGMPIHPRFFERREVDVAAGRRALGLDPSLPTVLVSFGGQGSRAIVEIVRRLDAGETPMNVVAVCGRNERARAELEARRARRPLHVVGFTDDVVGLMRLADLVVGKPGPLSIHEALACGLPLVAWDNPAFGVLFDENLRWIEREGVGLRVRSTAEVPAAVARVVAEPAYRRAAARFTVDPTAQAAARIAALARGDAAPAPHGARERANGP